MKVQDSVCHVYHVLAGPGVWCFVLYWQRLELICGSVSLGYSMKFHLPVFHLTSTFLKFQLTF
jgi:hypothetical protein